MNKLYMGIDIGSTFSKGVVIDKYNNIISSVYIKSDYDYIKSLKEVILKIRNQIDLNKYQVVSVGVTGYSRKLIGTILDASVVKNEIIANAVGTTELYPNVRTIFEIGGQESKVIYLNKGIVTDYDYSSLCLRGTGTFIMEIAEKLGIDIENINQILEKSNKRININSKCIIFALNEIIHKLQDGYQKEDIIVSVCNKVADTFVKEVIKNKKIIEPVVINGGVSKNKAVIKELKRLLNINPIIDKNSHLITAIGIAIIAKNSKIEKIFNFDIENINIETKITNCTNCSSNCEIVNIYKNDQLLDFWGNKCNNNSIVSVK